MIRQVPWGGPLDKKEKRSKIRPPYFTMPLYVKYYIFFSLNEKIVVNLQSEYFRGVA